MDPQDADDEIEEAEAADEDDTLPVVSRTRACPACALQVSRAAKACPHCGHPFRAQTIEKTSKALKKQLLTAALIAIAGVPTCAVAPPFGAAMVLGGLVYFIAIKIHIWWQHG